MAEIVSLQLPDRAPRSIRHPTPYRDHPGGDRWNRATQRMEWQAPHSWAADLEQRLVWLYGSAPERMALGATDREAWRRLGTGAK